MRAQMHLPAVCQNAARLEALGPRLCGRQHIGHLRYGLQRMPLGVGMRPSGRTPSPCVCPAVLDRIPQTEGSACTAHRLTRQTLTSERPVARLVLQGSLARMEFTVWSAR